MTSLHLNKSCKVCLQSFCKKFWNLNQSLTRALKRCLKRLNLLSGLELLHISLSKLSKLKPRLKIFHLPLNTQHKRMNGLKHGMMRFAQVTSVKRDSFGLTSILMEKTQNLANELFSNLNQA